LPELDHWWMYGFPALTVVLFGIGVALFCDGAERFLSSARRSP
jgi:ABC-type dipeptide/oligopeptide/nickel transport system permease subunit